MDLEDSQSQYREYDDFIDRIMKDDLPGFRLLHEQYEYDLDTQGPEGSTVLHAAAAYGRLDIVQYALANGAVQSMDEQGRFPHDCVDLETDSGLSIKTALAESQPVPKSKLGQRILASCIGTAIGLAVVFTAKSCLYGGTQNNGVVIITPPSKPISRPAPASPPPPPIAHTVPRNISSNADITIRKPTERIANIGSNVDIVFCGETLTIEGGIGSNVDITAPNGTVHFNAAGSSLEIEAQEIHGNAVGSNVDMKARVINIGAMGSNADIQDGVEPSPHRACPR